MIRRHGTTAGVYAHASVGCLHVRPVVNMKTEAGVRQFEAIASASADLVLEYGGALSGEHGDGLVRSCFMERIFGPALYEAFRHIKQTFDPGGIFDPGKIVDAPPLTGQSAIRSRVSRRAAGRPSSTIPTTVDWLVRSKCAAASAPAAKCWMGRCARRTWRRGKSPIRRGDARTCCGWPCRTAWRSGSWRRGRASGARPVPGVSRLQGRVPRRRGRGAVQERVSRRLLAPTRNAHPCAHARTRPPRVTLGQPLCSPVECDRAKWTCALAERAAARHRSASHPAGMDGHSLRGAFSETSAPTTVGDASRFGVRHRFVLQ